jgi:hypothetical protein
MSHTITNLFRKARRPAAPTATAPAKAASFRPALQTLESRENPTTGLFSGNSPLSLDFLRSPMMQSSISPAMVQANQAINTLISGYHRNGYQSAATTFLQSQGSSWRNGQFVSQPGRTMNSAALGNALTVWRFGASAAPITLHGTRLW